MSHTPGPWRVQPNPIGGKHIIITAATDRPGATLEVIAAVPAYNARNVPLLTAAPDLLQVLKDIDTASWEINSKLGERIRGAIRQAEGETK